jgi:hypothetical protein
MATTGDYIGAFGDLYSAYGERQRGKMAKSIGKLRKKKADESAKRSIASAQRSSLEERRQAEIKASRALAVASAGGGGADDPTVSKIIEDIHGEGVYRAAVAMYEGEEEARQKRYAGTQAEIAGDSEYESSKRRSYGKIISGLGKTYG